MLTGCTTQGWQVHLALQRLAGLRKSESDNLEITDVDLDEKFICVHCSKTARADGNPDRMVPILYPQLERLLKIAIAEADASQQFLVPLTVARSRGTAYQTFARICRRAGLKKWREPFKCLRRSCATELRRRFGASYVTDWLGHSEDVEQKHYLRVTESVDELRKRLRL